MEEYVGTVWHKLISQKANINHQEATVSLSDLQSELATYYRAMGGDPGKSIEAANTHKVKIHRRFIDKVAGSQQRFYLAWQDERCLRLPPTVSICTDTSLNEDIYFWLTAMAAQMPNINSWFTDNQFATLQLLKKRPGLKRRYHELVEAVSDERKRYWKKLSAINEQEIQIQQALSEPGSVKQLIESKLHPLPVALWLYPSPWMPTDFIAAEETEEGSSSEPDAIEEADAGRKQANREDDSKETDGLLIFRLESLFSWTEHIPVDRPQEEDMDEDAKSAAEDLDVITLSKKRRAGAAKIRFDMDLPSPIHDELPLGEGIRLPEWDYKKQQMRDNFCLLQPFLADEAPPTPMPVHLRALAAKICRQFELLIPERRWLNRQSQGEELDLNAWIDHLSNPTQSVDMPDCYRRLSKDHRDLSCLLLADISMSTDAAINDEQKVIDVIKDSLVIFSSALASSRDHFALYGFSSVKNKQIRYHLLKNFNEPLSDGVYGRIHSLKPGYYTRMGTAIRQSTEILKEQKTQQKLMLILSDGKPNDIDHYEGRYGIEDTRQAILEAKKQGIKPFCITIDHEANKYLPYLFGEQGFCLISDPARLPILLPRLYLNLTKN
ncbi:hypothetical protein CDW43_01930 [Methylophaga nitratireducenticrescens]|nr:hypothetical protein CDW43_01930 [Methylophaga nitratireducenticrescens]